MITLISYLIFGIINAKYLRKHSKILQRLNDIHWSALVTGDIIIGFIVFNILYFLYIIRDRPHVGETISSFSGRYSQLGRPWAKKLAKFIDFLFLTFANQHDHCEKEAYKWVNRLNLS